MKPRNLFQYYRAMMTIALLVFAGSALFAQGTGNAPDAPKEIFAHWMASDNAKLIQVMWVNNLDRGDNEDITGYNLYQSFNDGAFSKVTDATMYNAPWGGQASLAVQEKGTYKFYVTAYNDAGESDRSPEASVKVTSWLQFEEPFVFDQGKSGEAYSKTFTAKSDDGAVITYSIEESLPENNATIDAATGVFSFTPEADGMYKFQIVASLADDADVHAMAFFHLQVGEVPNGGGCPTKKEPCAVIKGIVRDKAGNLVENGVITFVPADGNVHIDGGTWGDGDAPWGDGNEPWGGHPWGDGDHPGGKPWDGGLDSATIAYLDSLMRAHGGNMDTTTHGTWGDGDAPWGDGSKPWGGHPWGEGDHPGGKPWDGGLDSATIAYLDSLMRAHGGGMGDIDTTTHGTWGDGDAPWGDGSKPWGGHPWGEGDHPGGKPWDGGLDSATIAYLDSLMRAHGGGMGDIDTTTHGTWGDGDAPWGDGSKPWGGHPWGEGDHPGGKPWDGGDKPWGDDEFPWGNGGLPWGPVGGPGVVEGKVVDGAYEVAVPKGSYYVMVGCELVTIATVDCGDTVTVDIVLSDEEVTSPTVTTYTVSGRVTRASDGSAVKAMVMFYSTEDAYMPLMVTETDADGAYSAELVGAYGSQQFSYLAQAIPSERDLYYQYFDGVDNPTEATAIAESRDDVNFSLGAMPVYNTSISGTVKNTEGSAVAATVFAFPTEDHNTPDILIPNIVETQDGNYTLQHLRPGTYVIGVIPQSGELAPGYYAGANQEVTIDWEQAEVVTIEENTTITDANMILTSVEAEGINVVDGVVRQQTGKIASKGEDVLGSTPLVGANVYAINKNGDIVASAVSRRDGKFRLTGFGKGDYRIYVDKVGFISSEHSVSFDKQGDIKDVNVELASQLATSVSESNNGVVGVTTYPNPAVNSVVSVRFTSFAGTAQLSLVDAMGKQVMSRNVQTVQGENTVQLNVNTLPAGVYMVTITLENSVVTAPVTVIR